jgi:SP family sugar:H+ symporter-like MFS transporter
VDEMYSDMSVKAISSKKWVPAGYISRNERDEMFWEQRGGVKGGVKDTDAESPERGMSLHQERVGGGDGL